MVQRQQQEITDLQSRLIQSETEKTQAHERIETLERKVESLQGYLDQERHRRFDLETQVKNKVLIEPEVHQKLMMNRDRIEKFQNMEADLTR
jgi:septal ring factor EnvC (AmiA/AmiB activator)